jgi:hypothetical protein
MDDLLIDNNNLYIINIVLDAGPTSHTFKFDLVLLSSTELALG